MKQVLIIQTASIGDVILATPLLESIYAAEDSWQIDIMVRRGAETLFTGHPFIRNVLVWDKAKRKYAGLYKLLRQIRGTKYDYVINLQRFASTGLVTAFSKAAFTIGFAKNPFAFLFSRKVAHKIGTDGTLHEVDRNVSLLNGIVAPVSKVKLYPSEQDFREIESMKQGRYICIAPASLWQTKKYPAEKWVDLIDSLPEGVLVYLIGSNTDVDLCNKIQEKCVRKISLNVSGKFSLLQTAALMKDALMNFTNDSAPQHLASAMNAPVATVFCSTVPAFGFGPLSEVSFAIETSEHLDCRPCGLHGYRVCPEKHFNCALTIKTEQLLSCLT